MNGASVIGAAVSAALSSPTAVESAAIAGAIKETAAKQAKAAIPEGHSADFDFTARFRGTLVKEFDAVTLGREVTNPAGCDLFIPPVVAAVLKKAGIPSADIRKYLKAIVKKSLTGEGEAAKLALPEMDDEARELLAPFIEVAGETAAKLPAVKTQVAGSRRAGAVKVTVAGVEILQRAG